MYEVISYDSLLAIASFDYLRQAVAYLKACNQKAFIVATIGCPIICNY